MLSVHRYQVVELPAETYDGQQLTVTTLKAGPGSLIDTAAYKRSGALGITGAVRPSRRYLQVIRDGQFLQHHSIVGVWIRTCFPSC